MRGERGGCRLTFSCVLAVVVNRSQVEKEAGDNPVISLEESMWTTTAHLRSFQAPARKTNNINQSGWKCEHEYRLKAAGCDLTGLFGIQV